MALLAVTATPPRDLPRTCEAALRLDQGTHGLLPLFVLYRLGLPAQAPTTSDAHLDRARRRFFSGTARSRVREDVGYRGAHPPAAALEDVCPAPPSGRGSQEDRCAWLVTAAVHEAFKYSCRERVETPAASSLFSASGCESSVRTRAARACTGHSVSLVVSACAVPRRLISSTN